MSASFGAVILGIGLLLSASRLSAESLDADGAMLRLVGSTWAGVNEDDQSFWFWHEGGPDSGRFAAKFLAASGQPEHYSGRWAKQGAQVCWTWPAWNATHCYVAFQLDGVELGLVRRDGVTHRGILSPGNSEHLEP